LAKDPLVTEESTSLMKLVFLSIFQVMLHFSGIRSNPEKWTSLKTRH